MDEKEKKSFIERVFFKVNSIDKVLESRVDTILLRVINMLKYINNDYIFSSLFVEFRI